MSSRAGLFLVIAVVGVSACASVPMAPTIVDAAAKRFAPPPPDRAHIYVYRNETFGAAVKMDLTLDGYAAGTTVAHTFTVLPVRPGHHTLTSSAENMAILPIAVQPGVNYFVWQEVKMGLLYARNQLQLMPPALGQQGVRDCGLIAAPPPPLPPLPPPPAPQPPPPPLPPGSPRQES